MKDKESIYLLQKLDCNCNNCKFLERDFVEWNLWKGYTEFLQYFDFLRKRRKQLFTASELIFGSKYKKNVNERSIKQGQILEATARKLKFQFDKSDLTLGYGICLSRKGKWNQPVTFVVETLQLDTQHCFVHRKEVMQ